MKHNKKRNTAFLYESLVKEMTKAALRSDTQTKSIIASILREHFHTNTLLHKELNLYKTLCEVRNVDRNTAEKILTEVKRVYHNLGEEGIFDEQTQVIKKINTNLSKKVYNNFISNYKTLATISQMFNSKTSISKKVILEGTLVDLMAGTPEERQAMRPIDNITYNMFVQKFNDKYGSSLNENQKYLLSRYVTLSPENAVEFKLYINDEISRLKEVVKKLQSKREVLLDESLSQKNREIIGILESFKSQKINDEMIKRILKMQALAVEA
jgi:hypothetical protein